jgi:hypothetical protein
MKAKYEYYLNVLQVVALDGTYYQKAGIVSSGKASLQQRAKHWLGEEILQAQNRKVCYTVLFITLNNS